MEAFALDPSDVKDEGSTYALNHCFEVNWDHRNDGTIITEHRTKLICTLVIIDEVILTATNIGIVILWIDALIQAEINAGAIL